MTILAGSIVVANFRGGDSREEPNKLRPAVVLQDTALFSETYGLLIVVPLTRDVSRLHHTFAVRLEPTSQNGCTETSWVLANVPTTIARRRALPTQSSITAEELLLLRQRTALAIGFPQVSPLLASFLNPGKAEVPI